MLSVVADETARPELRTDLDELAREGARRMLAAVLEAEVDDYLAAHAAERDERGCRLVVRNGHARQREVLTVAGSIPVQTPRVDDRRVDPATGQRPASGRRSCHRGAAGVPGSVRCCRCCT
jgi:putative transposase